MSCHLLVLTGMVMASPKKATWSHRKDHSLHCKKVDHKSHEKKKKNLLRSIILLGLEGSLTWFITIHPLHNPTNQVFFGGSQEFCCHWRCILGQTHRGILLDDLFQERPICTWIFYPIDFEPHQPSINPKHPESYRQSHYPESIILSWSTLNHNQIIKMLNLQSGKTEKFKRHPPLNPKKVRLSFVHRPGPSSNLRKKENTPWSFATSNAENPHEFLF